MPRFFGFRCLVPRALPDRAGAEGVARNRPETGGVEYTRPRTRQEARMEGVAQVFDLHALKDFARDKRVRKMLFKTDQLWSEIACYEPGQSTVMHTHPREE